MPNKNRILKVFWTIIALTFLCVIINFPTQLPIKFNIGNFKIDHTFYRPDFSFKIGQKEFKKNMDLKYGLDLAGGASLIFDIDTSNTKKEDLEEALNALKANIERRVNLFGVSETNVKVVRQDGNYRLNVELPGVEDISSAIKLIGTTAQLSFKGEITLAPEATASATFNDVFSKDTGINGSHLIRSTVQINPNDSKPEVSLEFNPEGSKLFAAATKEFLNKRIAILIDDYPVTYPTVNSSIGVAIPLVLFFKRDKKKK